MIETIREYLVSLGFKVDNSSLRSAQGAMKEAEASVTSFANESIKEFAKAAVGVVTFVATATNKLTNNIYGTTQPDTVAQTVTRTTTAALTRFHQGVIR